MSVLAGATIGLLFIGAAYAAVVLTAAAILAAVSTVDNQEV